MASQDAVTPNFFEPDDLPDAVPQERGSLLEVDEIAGLREALKAANANAIHERDLKMRLLKERSQWETAVRSAAVKTAWNQIAFKFDLYVVGKLSEPYGQLCGRIEMLPERPKPDQIERLKWAAQDVRGLFRQKKGTFEQEMGGVFAELERLREAVRVEGAKLHAEYGEDQTGGRYCECPGCNLIRGIEQGAIEDAPAYDGDERVMSRG